MSKQQTTYLYYKGEKSNPFEETTATQGAHVMRYNNVAVEFWFFEYHWANGWDKYSKLEVKAPDAYYEQYKEPQKEFGNIAAALAQFFRYKYGNNYPFLHTSSQRWQMYLYEHGMEERFYKPLHNIVPTDSVPAYLHWYKGENINPYTSYPQENSKRLWWDFESTWFAETEQPTQQAFEAHLHGLFVRHADTPWEALPKSEQERLIALYKAGGGH